MENQAKDLVIEIRLNQTKMQTSISWSLHVSYEGAIMSIMLLRLCSKADKESLLIRAPDKTFGHYLKRDAGKSLKNKG